MHRPIAAALALAAAFAASPAAAADTYELKVLGFSPDGRYFGFVQYGTEADAGTHSAQTFVIDATQDRYVPGMPVRVKTEMREENPDEAHEIKELLAKSAKRNAAALSRYNPSRPGTVLAKTGDPESKSLTAKHPALGALEINLEIKEIVWPRTSKLGAHKEAGSCAEEVDWQKGAGFRLTLGRGSAPPLVLNDDKTIPASRFCVVGYSLAEVRAFDRPDGKVSLAVLLRMATRGFEGQDQSFLAVIRVIDR